MCDVNEMECTGQEEGQVRGSKRLRPSCCRRQRQSSAVMDSSLVGRGYDRLEPPGSTPNMARVAAAVSQDAATIIASLKALGAQVPAEGVAGCAQPAGQPTYDGVAQLNTMSTRTDGQTNTENRLEPTGRSQRRPFDVPPSTPQFRFRCVVETDATVQATRLRSKPSIPTLIRCQREENAPLEGRPPCAGTRAIKFPTSRKTRLRETVRYPNDPRLLHPARNLLYLASPLRLKPWSTIGKDAEAVPGTGSPPPFIAPATPATTATGCFSSSASAAAATTATHRKRRQSSTASVREAKRQIMEMLSQEFRQTTVGDGDDGQDDDFRVSLSPETSPMCLDKSDDEYDPSRNYLVFGLYGLSR